MEYNDARNAVRFPRLPKRSETDLDPISPTERIHSNQKSSQYSPPLPGTSLIYHLRPRAKFNDALLKTPLILLAVSRVHEALICKNVETQSNYDMWAKR